MECLQGDGNELKIFSQRPIQTGIISRRTESIGETETCGMVLIEAETDDFQVPLILMCADRGTEESQYRI